MMRCKVVLHSITRSLTTLHKNGAFVQTEIQELLMRPVTRSGAEENHDFWAATPSGEIRLGVVNAEAVKHLVLGGEYYVDFTPASDDSGA